MNISTNTLNIIRKMQQNEITENIQIQEQEKELQQLAT